MQILLSVTGPLELICNWMHNLELMILAFKLAYRPISPHDLDYCFSQLPKYLKHKKDSTALSGDLNASVTPHRMLNLELNILSGLVCVFLQGIVTQFPEVAKPHIS